MISHIYLEGTTPASAQRDEAEALPPSIMISAVNHEEDIAAINDENTLLIKPRIKRKKQPPQTNQTNKQTHTPKHPDNYSSSQRHNVDFLHEN